MKFSREMLKHFALLLISVFSMGCSLNALHSPARVQSPSDFKDEDLKIFRNSHSQKSSAPIQKQVLRQRLEILRQEEHKNPLDFKQKYELAAAEWCLGQKSLAYENWAWIQQYAPQSALAVKSLKWMNFVDSKTEDKINEELPCPSFETDT